MSKSEPGITGVVDRMNAMQSALLAHRADANRPSPEEATMEMVAVFAMAQAWDRHVIESEDTRSLVRASASRIVSMLDTDESGIVP